MATPSRDRVILRASPDWLSFDLADARAFLRRVALPEDMLDQFVGLWDGALRVGYREVRHRLKRIAHGSATMTGAAVGTREEAASAAHGDRLVFLDDDDWLAPDLFAQVGPVPDDPPLGWRWGSVRIGLDYDPTVPGAAVVQLRPLSPFVYTNNYAVSGAAAARHGLDALFEHDRAHELFAARVHQVVDRPDYLSCALKHPCSTTAARHLLADPAFRRDPAGVVARFAGALHAAAIPPEAAWLAEPVRALAALLDEAAG